MRIVIPTNPSINPPISDPNKITRSDAGKKLIIESLHENEKAVFLIGKMIPKIIEKYRADPVFLYQFYDFCEEIVKLSIHEIRKKMEEMKDFDQQFNEHYIGFSLAGLLLSEIVASDLELLEEYRKMKREYDHDDDHNDSSKNNNNNDDDEQNYKKIYSYIYYKAIHPGKKECRIKESEIPSHARKN